MGKNKKWTGGKVQKSARKKLIEKLDKVFSLYIRQRNAENGIVRCFTCGMLFNWQLTDCGHFVSRKKIPTRWEEKNCAVQCKSCNIFSEGNKYIFGKKLNEKYGEGTAERLIIKSNNISKITEFELGLLIKEFEQKLKLLKK